MDKKALEHFRKVDANLYGIALKVKLTKLSIPSDYFVEIVDSIISQQLSGKAAATIFGRFKNLFPNQIITPEKLLKKSDEEIRACGISYSKIKYIKGVAKAIVNNEIDLKKLESKSDEEVISELVKLKGVGRWTAEMFLIFTLRRQDIFSAGDLGLQNAVIKHYKLSTKPQNKELIELSLKWSPYRSLASRILWKSLELND